MPSQRHVFTVLTEHKPGVLARVAGLFSARGFNIESLSVGPAETPGRARMTIVVQGDPAILEQVRKQLEKLIDTVKVLNLTAEDHFERGLALVKLRVAASRRAEVMRLAEVFHARVIDLRPKSMILEVTGTDEKIDRFAELLRDLGRGEGLAPDTRRADRLLDALAAILERAGGEGAPALRNAASGLGAVRGRGGRGGEAGIVLVEMVRTGRIAMKRGD